MLNLMAPINDLGYGVVGANIAFHLSLKGNYSLFPIGGISVHSESMKTAIVSGLNNARNNFSNKIPSLKIYHQFDMGTFPRGKKYIGMPIFELDNFTKEEKVHLESLDGIFACSHWAKSVLENSLKNCPPVSVIPLGVDQSIFYPSERKSNKTIFLNVGKWEKRKGHDILARAFKAAFGNSEEVELRMLNSNPFLTKQETDDFESEYRSNNIKLLPRVDTHYQVAEIMRQADCGVFPSRAEGWNLEALEMLSCGRDLIITNYSAHTEFCTIENSRLIDVYGLEVAQDGKWFFGTGKWANLDKEVLDNLVDQLRIYHSNRPNSINAEGVKTASRFSWTNTVERILECLE